MSNSFGELERIEFGHGDDTRCILVGKGIPFRFGKMHELRYSGGAIHIYIKPDQFTERAMQTPGRWGRVVASLRGFMPW